MRCDWRGDNLGDCPRSKNVRGTCQAADGQRDTTTEGKEPMSLTMAIAAQSLLALAPRDDRLPTPVPFVIAAGLPDAAIALPPEKIHVGGWLGARIDANVKNRLLAVDIEPLLAGYRKRPGSHPWIGEHVGKWMHAASLAWAYSGDPALKAKLDAVAADLSPARSPMAISALTSPNNASVCIRGPTGMSGPTSTT